MTPSPASRPVPQIIQGGMGVGVSSWRLARRVAELLRKPDLSSLSDDSDSYGEA